MITNPTVIPYHRTVSLETHIVILDCYKCGVHFGLGDDFVTRRREDHQNFYCPNGHAQGFHGKSDVEKERDRLKRDLDWAKTSRDSWKDQATAAEHRRRGQKAANTKLRKRIAAGVCPCCQRSFQNVAQHMSNQHPNYTVED